MSAIYTNIGPEAADHNSTSDCLTGAKSTVWDSPEISQLETEGGFARSGNAAALGASDWLCLAAAPSFAIMALLTGVLGPLDTLCSAGHDASPLSGMIPMYLLMSAFHSAPWLKLISNRRSESADPHRSCQIVAETGGF